MTTCSPLGSVARSTLSCISTGGPLGCGAAAAATPVSVSKAVSTAAGRVRCGAEWCDMFNPGNHASGAESICDHPCHVPPQIILVLTHLLHGASRSLR